MSDPLARTAVEIIFDKLDRIDAGITAGFDTVDQRFTVIDQRLSDIESTIDRRLTLIESAVVRIADRLGKEA